VVVGVEDACRGVIGGRVVVRAVYTEDLLYDVAGPVEGDGGARAAHAADEILAFVVDQADDGELVGGKTGGAAPFMGDFDRAAAEEIC
jgi:hypothetical protein